MSAANRWWSGRQSRRARYASRPSRGGWPAWAAARKGSPLEIARIAGIQAAKRTADLIPLCHPLALSYIDVQVKETRHGYRVTATVRLAGKTGVEMEALTAVSIAALTIYDMLKAADKAMTIDGIRLVRKTKREAT